MPVVVVIRGVKQVHYSVPQYTQHVLYSVGMLSSPVKLYGNPARGASVVQP